MADLMEKAFHVSVHDIWIEGLNSSVNATLNGKIQLTTIYVGHCRD